jgi:hypothetical protein
MKVRKTFFASRILRGICLSRSGTTLSPQRRSRLGGGIDLF